MPHLTYSVEDRVATLMLNNPPQNRIDEQMADELAEALDAIGRSDARAVLLRADGTDFSFGGDIVTWPDLDARELRTLFERYMSVFNRFERLPLPVIAAVHGLCFGGGFELALACDLIVADKMTRFCFPELRLGLIPGFGGIPRLKRDIGNGVVRDLLLTGRSINATKALAIGLASQVAAEGEALSLARHTAAQITKFDRATAAAAKRFIKSLPAEELRREIDIFCQLFAQPAVMQGLRKFVEDTGAHPYLP